MYSSFFKGLYPFFNTTVFVDIVLSYSFNQRPDDLPIHLFYKDNNKLTQIVPERNLCVIAELAPDGKFSVQIFQLKLSFYN